MAVLAIAGVWLAARPAWRQVELLKIQTVELTRERLAERYRMIREAIKALEWDQWVQEHRLHPGTPVNKVLSRRRCWILFVIERKVSGKETPSGAADAGQGISDIRLL